MNQNTNKTLKKVKTLVKESKSLIEKRKELIKEIEELEKENFDTIRDALKEISQKM